MQFLINWYIMNKFYFFVSNHEKLEWLIVFKKQIYKKNKIFKYTTFTKSILIS